MDKDINFSEYLDIAQRIFGIPVPSVEKSKNILLTMLSTGDKETKVRVKLGIIGPEAEDFLNSPIFPLIGARVLEDLIKDDEEKEISREIFKLTLRRMLKEIEEKEEFSETFITSLAEKSEEEIKKLIVSIFKESLKKYLPKDLTKKDEVEEAVKKAVEEVKKTFENSIFKRYGIKLEDIKCKIEGIKQKINNKEVIIYLPKEELEVKLGKINYEKIVEEIAEKYKKKIKEKWDFEVREGDKVYNPYRIIEWMAEKEDMIVNPKKLKEKILDIYKSLS